MTNRDMHLKSEIRELTPLDPDFPKRLRNIPRCPRTIYVRGSLPKDDVPSAAIIGARDATPYGLDIARSLGSALAGQGIQIISGMAYGIDAAGQWGAVDAGAETFAVFGCGLDICYPESNFRLYDKLLCLGGGAISEHPLESPPLPSHFASRNRIIAGLADVVLVIEAKERSGTFITVGNALEQGKEVLAVPGRINDRLSRGCNELIRQGAGILTSVDDVLEVLNLKLQGELLLPERKLEKLSRLQKKVYLALAQDVRHMDEIIAATGLSVQRTAEVLVELEMMDYIESPRVGYYRQKLSSGLAK